MEYKKAITILENLLGRYSFDNDEKEAVMTAISVLGWGSVYQSRIKAQKAKRDKDTKW